MELTPSTPSPASNKRAVLLGTATILLACLWVYLPALRGDWLWDDLTEVATNTALRNLHGLRLIWEGRAGPDFFPIKSSVQWVEWHLFGDRRAGYHVVNLLLHVVSSLLVWRLLHRLGVRMAFLGGLLFAVHPLAVESVAWVSELKNALSLPLLLLSTSAYFDLDNTRKKTDYLAALFLVCDGAALQDVRRDVSCIPYRLRLVETGTSRSERHLGYSTLFWPLGRLGMDHRTPSRTRLGWESRTFRRKRFWRSEGGGFLSLQVRYSNRLDAGLSVLDRPSHAPANSFARCSSGDDLSVGVPASEE